MAKLSALNFAVLIVLAQAGCASQMKVALPTPVAPPTGAVRLVDGRPADQRSFRGPSPWGGSFVTDPKRFLGDENFDPDRLSVLRQKIESRVTGRSPASPLTVTVTRFEVIDHYEKTHREASASEAGMSLGLVGLAVEQAMKPGAGVTDRYICEIQGSAESQSFAARLDRPYDQSSAGPTLASTVDLCAEMAAQDLASKLAKPQAAARKAPPPARGASSTKKAR